MKNRTQLDTARAIRHATYENLVAEGAANGAGSRSRTFLSKRDKESDPKRQRKEKNWLRDW